MPVISILDTGRQEIHTCQWKEADTIFIYNVKSSHYDLIDRLLYLFSPLKKLSMNFKMYLNKDLVENIPLAKTQVELPGYIQGLRHLLEEKHETIIKQSREKPEYFIDGLESRMNL